MKTLFCIFILVHSLICLQATEDTVVHALCAQVESHLNEGDKLLQPFEEKVIISYQTVEDAILRYRQASSILSSFLRTHTDLSPEQRGPCKKLYAAIKEKSARASIIQAGFILSVVERSLMELFYENTYPLNLEDLQSLVSIHEISHKDIPTQLQQTIACLRAIGSSVLNVVQAAELAKQYPLAKLSLAIDPSKEGDLHTLSQNPDFKNRLIALRLVIQFRIDKIDLSPLSQLSHLELSPYWSLEAVTCSNLSSFYLSSRGSYGFHLICRNSTYLKVNQVDKITCPNLLTLEVDTLPREIEASDLPKLEELFVKQDITQKHLTLPCLKYLIVQGRIIQTELDCQNLQKLISTENSQTKLHFPNSTFLEITGGWGQCDIDFSNVEILLFETKESWISDFRSLKKLNRLLMNAPNAHEIIIPRNAFVDEHSTLHPDCKITYHWAK